LTLQDRYKELTTVDIQSGKPVVLWKDNWNSSIRQDMYPHLHSFAKNQSINIDKAIEIYSENIYYMFHLPLSTIAHEELHKLEQEFLNLEITEDHDIWSFSWGSSYSTEVTMKHQIVFIAAVIYRWQLFSGNFLFFLQELDSSSMVTLRNNMLHYLSPLLFDEISSAVICHQ
jgi:hypothetical protein